MIEENKVTLIMLGESGVGKTSLLLRFCKNVYKEVHNYTSIDYYNKNLVLKDKNVKLEIWDTAGQERFRAIMKEYFRRADGAILSYDTTNLETFKKLPNWLNLLREINEEATIMIVGNKTDLQHGNPVFRSDVENYALKEGLEFCEASAKKNENVNEVFKSLAIKVLVRKKIHPFYEEILDGETKDTNERTNEETKNNVTFESNEKQTENSLPPIIRLDEDVGDDIHRVKLTLEKRKQKTRAVAANNRIVVL